MGKKGYKQRQYERDEKIIGEVAPNPNAPVQLPDNPLEVLKEIKKEQLINFYHQKLGVPLYILNIIWEHLEKMPEHKIKQLKKGNIKNIIKRKDYSDIDVIRSGVIYDCNKEKGIEDNEKLNDEEIVVIS